MRTRLVPFFFGFVGLAILIIAQTNQPVMRWQHLSTANKDLEPPNTGTQQTSATVLDIDGDGINDFVISERTAAPAMVWYRRQSKGWKRYLVEGGPLPIEAGTTFADVDGDGDLDLVAGGDYRTNEVWWWENPSPRFDPAVSWRRHLIKNTGGTQHHDLIFGDFRGNGKQQLIFWNQGSHALLMADIPANPRASEPWPSHEVYSYGVSSEPEQRGEAASFKSTNSHEGLTTGDVDGDGKLDIVGGGHWFRNLGNGAFEINTIDAGYTFSRSAVGHLLTGSREEQIVLVIGDGEGPLLWYGLEKNTWVAHKIAEIKYGHTLQLVDINHDGNLDIFCAEQRLNGANPDSKIYFFLGDGKGSFTPTVVATGLDSHESRIADLDGDGILDILIKPYNYQTPRLDVFLNKEISAAQ